MRYHSFDRVRICETTGMQDGYLRIDVVNSENNFPIEGAEVSVSYGDSGQTQEVLRTNLSGQTEEIAVAAPPVSLSLEEQNREKPYADYTVEVRAAGYEPVKVKGTEVLAGVTALLARRGINLATMQLYRTARGGYAVMIVESDQAIPTDAIYEIEQMPGILKVTYLNTEE